MKEANTPRRRVLSLPKLMGVAHAAGQALFMGLFTLIASCSAARAEPPTIVLVGGMKAGLPQGEHDYADGVLKLERLINASPDFGKLEAEVRVYPVGFPEDVSELEDASVLVLYFGTRRSADGSNNPAQDPEVRQVINELADRGAGLVALHQAFTVPKGTENAPFLDWFGAVRVAVTDSTVETAPVAVTAKAHPVANSISPSFALLDEFYPTIEFGQESKVTPVLEARIHTQYRGPQPVFAEPPSKRPIAWAYERPGGGRSFAFSGGHYLRSFDHPEVRTLVLNAIFWAAHADVPEAGVLTSVPTVPASDESMATDAVPLKVVVPASEVELLPQSWGELEWFASRPIGNSTTMTVGRAKVSPGKANPPHWHPNCDEILYVVQGHIMHRVGDKEYEMRAGDTVVIPEGTVHNARNIGTEEAVLWVSFNSADRFAIGE